MELADVIFGIKIKRTLKGFILRQSHNVDNILGKFDKDNSGIARTPVDVTLHLSKNKGESVSQVEYSREIGSLMFLMSCTRLDISYTVNRLSRYTRSPKAMHWQGIERVLNTYVLLMIMDCTIQDTSRYLKDIVMPIGYPILKTLSPIVVMCLY